MYIPSKYDMPDEIVFTYKPKKKKASKKQTPDNNLKQTKLHRS